MVKNFKGKVHVEDVRNEFDILVSEINTIIDAYNSSDYINNIDYNNVSADLAPSGYTLSIGGLKKVLLAYDGFILGCKVFTNEDMSKYIISNGLLFKTTGGIRLPAATIDLDKVKPYLFFNTTSQTYSLSDSETSANIDDILVTKLNYNRDIPYSNTETFEYSNQETLDILVGNNGNSWGIKQDVDNTDKAVFVGCSTPNYRTEADNNVTLFGVLVSSFHPVEKTHLGGACKPKLFLPKGVANPYNSGWGGNQQLVYPVNVTKTL